MSDHATKHNEAIAKAHEEGKTDHTSHTGVGSETSAEKGHDLPGDGETHSEAAKAGQNAIYGQKGTDNFTRTKPVAVVEDMRLRVLMPDCLHWLGIKKIDNMISMSDMKHDAIVESGIPIKRRYEIPEDLIPPDSRVEIDTKIYAGYWSSTKVTDLSKTAGRAWEDLIH